MHRRRPLPHDLLLKVREGLLDLAARNLRNRQANQVCYANKSIVFSKEPEIDCTTKYRPELLNAHNQTKQDPCT